jgi:hypothetical protein
MHLVRYGMAAGLLKKGRMFVDHRGAALAGAALLVAAVLGEGVVPARAVGICGNNNLVPVPDPNATGGINCVLQGSGSQSSNLGSVVNGVSQTGIDAMQSQLQTIRDQIQQGGSIAAGRVPLGYASDPWPSDEEGALGYANGQSANVKASQIFLKAPPKPPQPSGWAAWGQAFGDYETRSGSFAGVNIGRNTSTGGFILGLDKTVTNLTSASDALVFGILANGFDSNTINAGGSTARVTGPSVGAYGVYVNGGFSTDLTFKVDFLSVDSAAGGAFTTIGLTNYTADFNVNDKIEISGGRWWIEPTVGVSNISTQWNSAALATGLTNGNDVRVRGGARFGWPSSWNNVPVEYTVGTYLYDDVSITGGTVASAIAPLVPSDQGLVFGQLVSKASFDWGKGLSSYVEAEIRGSTNIVGVAGRAGARYQW